MYIIRVRKKDNHFVSSLSLSLPTSLYQSINYIQNFVFFYNHCCTLFINAVKRARKRREERERGIHCSRGNGVKFLCSAGRAILQLSSLFCYV